MYTGYIIVYCTESRCVDVLFDSLQEVNVQYVHGIMLGVVLPTSMGAATFDNYMQL